MWRCARLRAERGVALITVMAAIFALSLVVATMAVAAMGETAMAFDHLRGQQALAVAEAGAYRALAELRRRLAADLDAQIGRPVVSTLEVLSICGAGDAVPPDPTREIVEIITNYAYPPMLPGSDWTLAGGAGSLRIGTAASPVQMRDAVSGAAIGTFAATIYVRWSGAPARCPDLTAPPARASMEFDYAVVATGRVGAATRTVCLRSPYADRCSDWLPSARPAAWAGSYTLTGGAYRGWPVLVERTPDAARWTATVTPYERPHWEELVRP